MNKAVIIGNLTRDPEARATGQGTAVTTFTVAVARRFTNAQGEKETDFIPVVTWRGLAETCAQYLKKGSKVAVMGEIRTHTYDAPDGSKRYVTDIQARTLTRYRTMIRTCRSDRHKKREHHAPFFMARRVVLLREALRDLCRYYIIRSASLPPESHVHAQRLSLSPCPA